MGRLWTQEEIEYLTENWGCVSIERMAEKLGRNTRSIQNKSYNLGLGSFLQSGDYVSISHLFDALGIRYDSRRIAFWLKEGLPTKTVKVIKKKHKVLMVDKFWEWAEEHQGILDFSNFEENVLGAEPSWVREKRRMDVRRKSTSKKSMPWTSTDDEKLLRMYRKGTMYSSEAAKALSRTEYSVIARIYILSARDKGRWKMHDFHEPWTDEKLDMLTQCIIDGKNHDEISETVGKSTFGIRRYLYSQYGTSNLDTVKKIVMQEVNAYGQAR